MSLFIAIAIGFLLSVFLPTIPVKNITGYEHLLYLLLAIGLYGSVYGIDKGEFKNHRTLIIRAVTLGVIVKSLIIGSVLWLIFHNPYAFLFGIIVAQIDPLSVARLIESKSHKFSAAGRTILRGWSSFDDPMTVLLALYLFLPIFIQNGESITLSSYFFQLTTNLLFALLVYLLNKKVSSNSTQLVLLFLAFLVAVPFKFMLGIAIVGLFFRPSIKFLSQSIHIAFITAAVILGSLLELNSTSILYGGVLGIVAYATQFIVTFLVAPKLNHTDKLFLSLAQYNGITSIILVLIVAQWIPQAVSVIAVAIIIINLLYHGSNYLLEKHLTSSQL